MAFKQPVEKWRPLVRETLAVWQERAGLPKGMCESLVLAVIAGESSGDPSAEGNNEVGLMQVVYQEAAERLGWPNPEKRPPREALLNPEVNVAWGVKILIDYYGEVGADWYLAVLAYNTGVRRVDDPSRVELRYVRGVMGWMLGDLDKNTHALYPCCARENIEPLDHRTANRAAGYWGDVITGGDQPCRQDTALEKPSLFAVLFGKTDGFPWVWIVIALVGIIIIMFLLYYFYLRED